MKTITITSDYGNQSHYVSAMKGLLAAHFPGAMVLDISDNHHPYDIIESSYIFNLIKDNFPPDTLHLFMVNTLDAQNGRVLMVRQHEQTIILPDNGSISMIFENQIPEVFVFDKTLSSEKEDWEIFTDLAGSFGGSNQEPDQGYKKFDGYQLKRPVQPVMNDDNLTGTVMFNDQLGHAHTNISRDIFQQFIKNGKYRILLSRHEWVDTIQSSLSDIREGEPFAAFNHRNFLYIGVKKGKSNQLMNLTKSRAIRIELL